MSHHQTPTGAITFGYLSAVESPEHGFFGGYLVISTLGRPVEFHCTAPIRPSRAQQILYGPTLQPYLLGEQIAGTLLAKAQTTPQIILTDQPSVISLNSTFSVPIICLVASSPDAGCGTSEPVVVAGHTLEFPASVDLDRSRIIDLLTVLAKHVDLPEPFDRIHEAIREAQRIGQGGPDTHAQAA